MAQSVQMRPNCADTTPGRPGPGYLSDINKI